MVRADAYDSYRIPAQNIETSTTSPRSWLLCLAVDVPLHALIILIFMWTIGVVTFDGWTILYHQPRKRTIDERLVDLVYDWVSKYMKA